MVSIIIIVVVVIIITIIIIVIFYIHLPVLLYWKHSREIKSRFAHKIVNRKNVALHWKTRAYNFPFLYQIPIKTCL